MGHAEYSQLATTLGRSGGARGRAGPTADEAAARENAAGRVHAASL
jgi:hypothetical protein